VAKRRVDVVEEPSGATSGLDVTTDRLDLELLTKDELIDMLSGQVDAGVNLAFPGKALTRRMARKVRPRVQRTVAKYSTGSEADRARNVLIEGDNLQTLVTLYRDRGRIDLILADPPYNTGGDFRYNDRWDTDPNDDGLGDLVRADDRARHTKWMKFMYPRLQMMREMLKPQGVLAICIDHRELFHLGQMLDELFGSSNRLAIINWEKIVSPKNHDHGVSTATEYVLVYAKDEERASTGKLKHSDATASSYVNPDDDPRGAWSPSDSTLMGAATHAGQVYGIQNPFTGRLHYPQEGRCWRNERAKMRAGVEEWGHAYEDRDLDDGKSLALVLKGARNPLTECAHVMRVAVPFLEGGQQGFLTGNCPEIVEGRCCDGGHAGDERSAAIGLRTHRGAVGAMYVNLGVDPRFLAHTDHHRAKRPAAEPDHC